MVWHQRQALHRGQHGDPRRLIDVHAVDGLRVHLGHRDGERDLADAAIELLALLVGELLRVLEPGPRERVETLRQDHRSGDHRAEECSASNLVHAGDGAEASVAKRLLGCVAADQELEHALLRGGGADRLRGAKRGYRDAHAGYEFTTI